MDKYSVYVGGCEINDYYLTKSEAIELQEEYINDGYCDVIIVKEG